MGKLNELSQRPDHGNGLHDDKNIVLLKPKYLVVQAIEKLAFKGEKHNLFIDIC